MSRVILRTDHVAQHPWPPSVFLQGGTTGMVIRPDGSTYTTAFVEAAPTGTFLRGEGETVAEAEDACWEQYLVYVHCDNPRDRITKGNWHGPFERRQYTNGAGFCTRCGMWMAKVFPPMPEDPDRQKTFLELLIEGMPPRREG